MAQNPAAETRRFSVALTREAGWYVAWCLGVDAASHGEAREHTIAGLREALQPGAPSYRVVR
jgi:hypothetical protein